MLEAIEQEREITLRQAEQQRADYRTAALMSVVMNAAATKKDGSAFMPTDFFPYFSSLQEESGTAARKELTTAETVEYLRRGFSLYVPR